MQRLHLRLLVLASVLASPGPAQSSCQPNLVDDGGFAARPSTWTKISNSGLLAFLPAADVAGHGPSPAVRLTTGNSVQMEQVLPFGLTAGVEYEVALDMRVTSTSASQRLYLRDAGNTLISLFGLGTAPTGRWRFSARFQVAATGAYRFSIFMAAGDVEYDNVRLRRTNGAPRFHVSTTDRRTGVRSRWLVTGNPNQLVAVTLTVWGSSARAPVPGCGSVPLEFLPGTLPLVFLGPVPLDAAGVFRSDSLSDFVVPASVAGVPFQWQPIGLPVGGPCQIGCPEVIAF